jgi:hypothetical protein
MTKDAVQRSIWTFWRRHQKSENSSQDPEDNKPHTYGAIEHQSGDTVTAKFFGNKPEGGRTDSP